MKISFKEWLIKETFRTGAKIGLYAPIEDALGQYPPLYGTPKAADLMTYIYLAYGPKGVKSKDGLVCYDDEDIRLNKNKKW